ncbi:MAG: hypothetical protein ACREKE_00115 [bacterium]
MKASTPAMAAALLFPALVLVGVWTHVDRRLLACVLVILVLWKWGGQLRRQGLLLLGLAATACVWLALERANLSLKAYPICVNLGLLAAFGQSLWRGPTVVERLATLQHGPLDEAGRRYTRTVTKAWCLFFLVNAGVSLATALVASDRVWALYNGGIAYGLIGLMFSGEWLIRRRVLRKAAEPGELP